MSQLPSKYIPHSRIDIFVRVQSYMIVFSNGRFNCKRINDFETYFQF